MVENATDRVALESKWLQNEAELNRIASAPGPIREMVAARWKAIESEQGAIEFALGYVPSTHPDRVAGRE